MKLYNAFNSFRYHLLIAIISPGSFFNTSSYNSSFFFKYQSPSIIKIYYSYLLLNISTSCVFPTHYTIGSSFHDYCITQDDTFPNPNPNEGFLYHFILRAVTSKLVCFILMTTCSLIRSILLYVCKYQNPVVLAIKLIYFVRL